jgi:hypothetical protein
MSDLPLGQAQVKIEFSGLRSPKSSPVFADGQLSGELGQPLPLSPGKHTIRVGYPPFCSQDLNVFLRPNASVLLLCNRSWLASVATMLIFGAIGCLLPGSITHTWHPMDGLVLLVMAVMLVCIAPAFGDRWLVLKQSQFHTDDPHLRVLPGGVKLSASSFPPGVLIDDVRAGALGEAIYLSPGSHTLHVGGWTVSSNKLACDFRPGDDFTFTCSESSAAWAVLGSVSSLMIAAFIALLWLFNHNHERLGIEVFTCAIAFSFLLCSAISRFVPTMKVTILEITNADNSPQLLDEAFRKS